MTFPSQKADLSAPVQRYRVKGQTSGRQLLQQLIKCAKEGVLPPEEIVADLSERLERLSRGLAKSWDEVLGQPYPKHYRSAIRYQRIRVHAPRVDMAIAELIAEIPKRPVDKEFWEAVGRRAGVGATKAEEIYRENLRFFGTGINEQRAELAILAAASMLLKQPTTMPFTQSVLEQISGLAGLPLDAVKRWHDRETAMAERFGEGIFQPRPNELPLDRFTPAKISKRSGVLWPRR